MRKLIQRSQLLGLLDLGGYKLFRRFWRTLPILARVHLLVAIFFTFSCLGFVIDVLEFPSHDPIPAVLATALFSGFAATAVTSIVFWDLRALPIVLVIVIASALLMEQVQHETLDWTFSDSTLGLFQNRLRLDAFGILISVMLGYSMFVGFISRTGARHLSILSEISLAEQLHSALVPDIHREKGGLEVFGTSQPSAQVGGDLLDLWQDEERTVAYVADVSGHGVSAGAVMGMAKSAVRMQLSSDHPMTAVLNRLNDVLCELTPANMFLTLASLSFSDGSVRVSSAGHLPVLHYSLLTKSLNRIESRQVPLALFPDVEFDEVTVSCGAGDLFLVPTDGIVEVEDRSGEAFGTDRLEALLKQYSNRPVSEIVERITTVVNKYGSAFDDQTLLLVRVGATPASNSSCES